MNCSDLSRAIGISSHHCLYNCGIQLALPGLS